GARTIGISAVEYAPQLGAWNAGFAQAEGSEVVIETAGLGVQGGRVGQFLLNLDAELAQVVVVGVEQHVVATPGVDFEYERLTIGITQNAVGIVPAGLGKQFQSAYQVLPQAVRRFGAGQVDHGAEHRRIQLVTPGFEQLQLGFAGRAAGGQRCIGEVAVDPAKVVVEDFLVDPLEVQGVEQRLAHAWVLELFLAQVDRVADHCRWVVVREQFLDQLPATETLADILAAPVAHLDFTEEIVVTAAQSGDLSIAVLV